VFKNIKIPKHKSFIIKIQKIEVTVANQILKIRNRSNTTVGRNPPMLKNSNKEYQNHSALN
jgi:hypothetical protein